MMDTPFWNIESTKNVYEPAEDSFLLLDALESDLQFIKDSKPTIVLEIGSGSGIIISALAKALSNTTHCIAIDINEDACTMTQETSLVNSAQVDIIQGDLSMCLKAKSLVDILIFNPPYVVTADEEISGDLQRSWAGGTKGRIVIDRLLHQVDKLLSSKAYFYLVAIKENVPEEIIHILKQKKYLGEQIASRKIRGEHLSVLRFIRL